MQSAVAADVAKAHATFAAPDTTAAASSGPVSTYLPASHQSTIRGPASTIPTDAAAVAATASRASLARSLRRSDVVVAARSRGSIV